MGEDRGAEFVGLDPRTLQARRQRGGGPKYVRISSRCIKYRRIDLKEWADGLLRQSTSDTGEAA
ncbi:MAG: DNA-binding protein [Sneathiella sp.]|nr:DNA-binding protein [Sneathiella sp.]